MRRALIDRLRTIRIACDCPNWDSYGANPIDKNCIIKAKLIIEEANPDNVVPLPSGGIQLEWTLNGIELEINPTSIECDVAIWAEGVDKILEQIRQALKKM